MGRTHHAFAIAIPEGISEGPSNSTASDTFTDCDDLSYILVLNINALSQKATKKFNLFCPVIIRVERTLLLACPMESLDGSYNGSETSRVNFVGTKVP